MSSTRWRAHRKSRFYSYLGVWTQACRNVQHRGSVCEAERTAGGGAAADTLRPGMSLLLRTRGLSGCPRCGDSPTARLHFLRPALCPGSMTTRALLSSWGAFHSHGCPPSRLPPREPGRPPPAQAPSSGSPSRGCSSPGFC